MTIIDSELCLDDCLNEKDSIIAQRGKDGQKEMSSIICPLL